MQRTAWTLLLGGCHIAEAPATLDEALHAWWDGAADASDADLAVVLQGTLDAIDVDALIKDSARGNQTRFTTDDLATIDFFDASGTPTDAPDPSLARPIYLIERLDCTLEAFEGVITYDDQPTLYGDLGHYVSYHRDYQTSKADYLSGAASTLSWLGTLQTQSILFTYEYSFRVDARRVDLPASMGIPGDQLVVTRDWMPFPATTLKGQVDFEQDYQLEVAIPMPEGDLLHVYPVWRQIQTSLGSMESDAVASFNLDQMAGWGKRTSKWCQEGLPQ